MRPQPIAALLLNYRDSVRSIGCINSLLDQPINQILVWDNSADGGHSASEIRARFFDDARVSLFVSTHNIGFAAGANRALLLCGKRFPGAWILFINNDARLLAGGAAKLRDVLLKNTEAMLAFPSIRHGSSPAVGPLFYHYWTGAQSVTPRLGSFPFASGCCLLIAPQRIAFPLYDEDFFMYGEDCELGWRLKDKEGAIVHVEEVLVEHDGAMSSGLGSSFYEERMVASHLILAKKLAGQNLGLRFSLYFLRTIMLLARASVRSVRFHSLIPWFALWRGWRIAFINDPMRRSK